MKNGPAIVQAAALGQLDDVKELLNNHDVDVNESDDAGTTAIINAAKRNDTLMVKLLIQGGADIEATDDFGYSAAIWAKQNDNQEMINLIASASSKRSYKARF